MRDRGELLQLPRRLLVRLPLGTDRNGRKQSDVRSFFTNPTFAYLILVIVAASLLLNLMNNDFPYYYHVDEKAKLRFIVKGGSNYRHPLMMIQINRFINLFAGLSDLQDVAVMARSVSAVFGAAIVFLAYLVSRETIGSGKALLAACAVALSPIVAVHAHYVKEDIIFTAFCTASLLFFFKLAEQEKRIHLLALGLCTGLAVSTKYIGILLVAAFLSAPLVCGLPRKRRIYKQLLAAIALCCATFLVVNIPIFFEMQKFLKGFTAEAVHVTTSDKVVVSALSHLFSFHFFNSIAPGVTWFVAIPAVVYIVYLSATWKRSHWKDRFLLLYITLFYFSAEISPMKTFPDFMRYMIPVVPPLCHFALRSFILAGRIFKSRAALLSSAAFCLCLLPPAYDTVNLVHRMNKDTRQSLSRWLTEHPGRALCELYTVKEYDSPFLFKYRKRKVPPDTEYLVASSFAYGRFLFVGERSGQNKGAYERYRFYKRLLEHSSVEFEPEFKSFGFSNPTLNVIKLSDLIRSGAVKSEDIGLKMDPEDG